MKNNKSVEKKVAATPVIFVDQSQQLSNTFIISKIINNKQNSSSSLKPKTNPFTAGFKYRPQSSNPQSNNLSNIQIPKIVDKATVYDEFGIINDSIGKKKYRQENKSINSIEDGARKMLSSNNPWQKQQGFQNDRSQEGIYEIAKLKERQQTAIHIKSSLQVINLQNIEAKLQVHRQNMKPIEQQYNLLKGKTSIVEPKDRLKFNIDVNKEYQQIQPAQIYQLIKQKQKKQQRNQEDIKMEQLWEEKKKNDPKLAQYDFKYQQYLVDKQAKKMIGSVVKDNLFNWDKYAKKEELQKRKMAKVHKSKQKEYGSFVQSKHLSKVNLSVSPGKQQQKMLELSLQNNSLGESINIVEKIASKDDKFIGKFIMAEIDIDKKGIISKDQLTSYLSQKQHIIKGYHIDLKWLHTDLDNFTTKRKGMLNQHEIVQFLATLDAIHHPSIILKDVNKQKNSQKPFQFEKQKQKNKPYTSYFKQNYQKFERVFSGLDFNDDRIIKRQEFIENILIDSQCNKILNTNVLVFNTIKKSITFKQILNVILDDYTKERNQKLKKSKEYITLQRFKQYFQIPQSLDLNSIDKNYRQKVSKQKSSNQIDLYDIQEESLLLLKDLFDTIPRIYQDYIVTSDFIMIALKDPLVLSISEDLCRIQSAQTKLAVETIKTTLNRMIKQCDQYSTWETLKPFFSRRGRPLDWDYELILKKKQVRQQQINLGSSFVKNISQSGIKNHHIQSNFQSLAGKQINRKPKQIEKYTIPKPFNITDQKIKVKNQKLTSTQEQQLEELKKQFKAKPLNKQILQPKPQLIQGKTDKSIQDMAYNYQNYENDRIQRVLKKAQLQFQQQEALKQIKLRAQRKANEIKIDLNKTLKDVIKEQKNAKDKSKAKKTEPINTKLCPDMKQQNKRKLQKLKLNLQKQQQVSKTKQQIQKDIQDKAKQRNEQVKQMAKEKKKKQEQQKIQRQKLFEDSFKPKINKYKTSQEQQEAMKKNKEERQKKKQEEIAKILQIEEKKKKKILSHIKAEKQLSIEGLDDEEILKNIEQINLQDILLDQNDRLAFRKEFKFRQKTKKQNKQTISGLAGRERAAMQTQERRLAQQKKELRQKKQSKIVEEKIQEAKKIKSQVNTTLNVDTNFHRSNALRRYRAIMQGKQALSQYDKYSRVGEPQKHDL